MDLLRASESSAGALRAKLILKSFLVNSLRVGERSPGCRGQINPHHFYFCSSFSLISQKTLFSVVLPKSPISPSYFSFSYCVKWYQSLGSIFFISIFFIFYLLFIFEFSFFRKRKRGQIIKIKRKQKKNFKIERNKKKEKKQGQIKKLERLI